MTRQVVAALLAPLGRAGERPLLGVPVAEDQRAAGREAASLQLAGDTRQLEHRRRAARRIDGAVDPCVVVVAEEDHLVRLFAAAQDADHVGDGACLERRLDLEVQPRRAGP